MPIMRPFMQQMQTPPMCPPGERDTCTGIMQPLFVSLTRIKVALFAYLFIQDIDTNETVDTQATEKSKEAI